VRPLAIGRSAGEVFEQALHPLADGPGDFRNLLNMTKERSDFELQWHGNTVVIIPAETVESMRWDLIESAAEVVMEPLRTMKVPMVVFDLSEVSYFGSVFIALLLRCHKLVKTAGGEMVICGATKMALELLKVTNLDTLWAMYDTREEALSALST
jgi:anti-anti-sigma factor